MSNPIPTYELSSLTAPGEASVGVFFRGETPGPPRVAIDVPYRSAYYKVGICLRGRAELRANLETYAVTPGCLVLVPPYLIKQWLAISADYDAADVFFTRAFVAATGFDPDRLTCFAPGAPVVVPLSMAVAQAVAGSLRGLRARYAAPGPYRTEVLTHLLQALLYEIAAACEALPSAGRAAPTRSGQLAAQFKQLVQRHYAAERGLDFYAARLGVTAKHLTETVKEMTGRTAGSWITEAVVLEAKVRLHNPAVSVGEVADELHFADQSAFGRFFKNGTGLSPTAYRQRA